nr:PREDICTED: protocadherin gamma-A11-like [Lepisosteus oculatus]
MELLYFQTAIGKIAWISEWRLQILMFFACAIQASYGQVQYSIPEEMTKGSFVGNIIQDLGLDIKRLKSGRARIFTEDSREYIGLNTDKGTLIVKDRIDREELCGSTSPCTLNFQIIFENPMELYRINVEILDINDNPPVFPNKEINLEISESSFPGTRFLLQSAVDPDVGLNSLQSYSLKPTDHFILKLHSRSDGSKYIEMMLQTALDREKQREHKLVLTAVDGGSPQKSGTVQINIFVLDANDNAPVFSQGIYKAAVKENAEIGTVVLKVSASDADYGTNGEVTYIVSHSKDSTSELFELNPITGEVKVYGKLDFEKSKNYEINVEARDEGGLTDSSKVLIEILDVNDNVPVITLMSFSNPIREDSLPDTVIAMLNIKDLDSGKNGELRCSISENEPFQIKSSSSNFFSLVTNQVLDREKISEYNITIIATDGGSPPFSSNKTLTLRISDVNDNAPVFEKRIYSAHIMENNSPGVSIFSIKAVDADSGPNAHISYFLQDTIISGISVSSYFSVNSESGSIHAVRSFDYERIKELQFQVKAQDGGSPPMSSTVDVIIFIKDQNDNSPQVLYPVHTDGSLVAEMVPRSADLQ